MLNVLHNVSSKLFFLTAVIGLLGLNACNTIEGAGQDIESVGDEIDDAAR